jgi:hypothetical protein
MPLLLRAMPRAYLGRVVALLVPLFGLASALASLIAGALAGAPMGAFHLSVGGLHLGLLDTIIAGAGMLVLCGGLHARTGLTAMPVQEEVAVVQA